MLNHIYFDIPQQRKWRLYQQYDKFFSFDESYEEMLWDRSKMKSELFLLQTELTNPK